MLSQGILARSIAALRNYAMTRSRMAIINAVALIIMLIVNGLANSLPLNGQTTGEVSARFPILFTPAPVTFSIWGLIYLFLLAFVVYQLFPAQHTALFLNRIGYWFALSCVLNCAWLVLWHYERFALTLIVMLGLVGSLIAIYQHLNIGYRRTSEREKWAVHVPFSLYLGWISVATLANLSVVVYTLNLDSLGLPPIVFTLILVLIATGLAISMMLRRNEIAYPLVIVWALIGIAARHQQALPVIAVLSALLACVILITLVFVRLDKNPELLNGIKTP
ncbi:MAG: tryptophan-rich sensory protein [Candidatus Vecturithrix sp.]|nr:tryptophan-rich sensory protein [Candidatus Vecturithrix sp.]